jgi:hypothetical protein
MNEIQDKGVSQSVSESHTNVRALRNWIFLRAFFLLLTCGVTQMILTVFPSIPLRNKEDEITSDREGQSLNQARFIHFVVCLQQVHKLFSKPVLHTVRSISSSLNFQYSLFSLKSSSNCIRLLPCRPVTYFLPSIFPSKTSFKRRFLSKTWPIYSAFLSCM